MGCYSWFNDERWRGPELIDVFPSRCTKRYVVVVKDECHIVVLQAFIYAVNVEVT